MIWANQRRRKFRFSRTRRKYAASEPMSGLGVEAHAALYRFHRGIGDRGDAFRPCAEHASHVPRIRDDLAVAPLKRLELRDHHLGHLLFQIAVAQTGEMRPNRVIILTAERLVNAEQ